MEMQKHITPLAEGWGRVLDVLLPPRCIICNDLLGDNALCGACGIVKETTKESGFGIS